MGMACPARCHFYGKSIISEGKMFPELQECLQLILHRKLCILYKTQSSYKNFIKSLKKSFYTTKITATTANTVGLFRQQPWSMLDNKSHMLDTKQKWARPKYVVGLVSEPRSCWWTRHSCAPVAMMRWELLLMGWTSSWAWGVRKWLQRWEHSLPGTSLQRERLQQAASKHFPLMPPHSPSSSSTPYAH